MNSKRLCLLILFLGWNAIVITTASIISDRPQIKIQGVEIILVLLAAVFISYRIGKAAGHSMFEEEHKPQESSEDSFILLSSQSDLPEEELVYGPIQLESPEVSEFARAVANGSIFLN